MGSTVTFSVDIDKGEWPVQIRDLETAPSIEIDYLFTVDYDGAGCVPSFCRLRQVYRASPDSSRDAGRGYVSCA